MAFSNYESFNLKVSLLFLLGYQYNLKKNTMYIWCVQLALGMYEVY